MHGMQQKMMPQGRPIEKPNPQQLHTHALLRGFSSSSGVNWRVIRVWG
jgi:hypothetical protein